MKFISCTKADKIHSIGFPCIMYDLKNFQAIKTSEKQFERQLIDAIGRVVACSEQKMRIVNGEVKNVMDITLEDNEGFQLRCTLWGEYVAQMVDQVGLGLNEPLIVLIQLCRVKPYLGEMCISTAFHATRMKTSTGSITLSCGNSQSQSESSMSQEIQSGRLEVLSIEELLSRNEAGHYWILATIVDIKNYKNWFYLGCASCNKKVNKEESRFRCSGCNKITAEGNYRYMINVLVMDSTDYTTITLWDRECTDLLGRSTSGMRDLMAEVKISDEIPSASSCLGGKRKHEIYKEADDPTKRHLDEEFGATKELLKMKAIKTEK
ncbi:unnamed protein product [Cuscuta campestris]|uniref:Replication factor A C-terminal domain-containing protein n=1 Tax=Cuscuta campestris TaxID=132261 RepID=A0A484N3H4_9ASTE|nr:unnamed protein product [Cuscuta campestris]